MRDTGDLPALAKSFFAKRLDGSANADMLLGGA
jgi:hypothetical protein